MKRGIDGEVEESDSKRILKPDPNDPLFQYILEFDQAQKELQRLDEACAHEQMVIQRAYDEKKQPFFEKRQAVISMVPGFWCKTLQHHPALCLLTPSDFNILQHLSKIDLKDNLDDNGSYRIVFSFDEKASDFMQPLTLVKHVVFEQNRETVSECTNIIWKPGKSPIEEVIRARNEEQCNDWSFFEWFTYDEWINKPNIGEIIRREIWHAPLAYYMDTLSASDFEYDDDLDD